MIVDQIVKLIEKGEYRFAESLIEEQIWESSDQNQQIILLLLHLRILRLEHNQLNVFEEIKNLKLDFSSLTQEHLMIMQLELASILFYRSRYEAAIAELNKIDIYQFKSEFIEESLLKLEYYDLKTKILVKLYQFNMAQATLIKYGELLGEHPNQKYEINYYLNHGRIEFIYGSMNNARKWFESALKVATELQNPLLIGRSFLSLASVSLGQEELDQSISHWLKAISHFNDLEDNYYLATCYYGLIRAYLIKKDKIQLDHYYQLLSELSWQPESFENSRIQTVRQLSFALIKMSQSRLRDVVLAENHFRELINSEIETQFKIEAIAKLGEILLFELKLFDNQEIITEIEQLAEKLEFYAGKSRSAMLIIYTLILRGKLAALVDDYVGAEKIFLEAIDIAIQRDFKLLHTEVLGELENIREDVKKFQHILKHNETITTSISKNEIETYLDAIRKTLH